MPVTNLPMPPRLSLMALAVRQQFQPQPPSPPVDPTISLDDFLRPTRELQAAVRRLSVSSARQMGKSWATKVLRQHLQAYRLESYGPLPLVTPPPEMAQQLLLPTPGQWWERLGQVVYLHPQMNPNDDPMFQGWKPVSPQEARRLLP